MRKQIASIQAIHANIAVESANRKVQKYMKNGNKKLAVLWQKEAAHRYAYTYRFLEKAI